MVVHEFGPFRLDAERLLLYRDGVPVPLGPKVVETLLALVEHAGEIVPKRALLERIWPEGFVDEANLSQNVYVLRKLLRGKPCEGAIETIARRGYRFKIPVHRCDTPEQTRQSAWRRRLPAVAVAAAIVVGLVAAGTWERGLSLEPSPTQLSAEARLFETGNFFITLRTRYALNRSVGIFTRAIGNDPTGARDYAGRASAHALLAGYGFVSHPTHERALAYNDVQRALALDPRCGRAYAVLGLLALRDRRTSDALSMLATAVTLAPADADAREWYGIALVSAGRIDDAANELQIAQRLNPLSIAATSWMASIAYAKHDYGQAEGYARQGLAVAPARGDLWRTLGLAQEAQGRYEDAIASFNRYSGACSGCAAEGAALLSYAEARFGRPDDARTELAIARRGTARPQDLALALAAVGDAGPSVGRLLRRLSGAERALAASDPRLLSLPSSEARLVENEQG